MSKEIFDWIEKSYFFIDYSNVEWWSSEPLRRMEAIIMNECVTVITSNLSYK